jgi:4'-phosphopantetheinyl transferase
VLGEHLDLSPRAIRYVREPCPRCGAPHGRPVLDGSDPPLHFSLSRSGDFALIVIASSPVGVDVEALSRATAVNDLTKLLHPAECAEIASASPSMRSAAFMCIWTRKEAYLKGTGTGLTHDLAADYVGVEARAPTPSGWTLATVPVARGYAGAVAILGRHELALHPMITSATRFQGLVRTGKRREAPSLRSTAAQVVPRVSTQEAPR